jgi:hypothetical protein
MDKYLNPQNKSNSTIVPATPLVERKVLLRVVENVAESDFKQATVVMEAWEKIGWDPGKPIANALNQGHGYEIKETHLEERFSQKIDQVIKENSFSSDVLLTYTTENYDPSKLIESPNIAGAELVTINRGVATIDDQSEKIIDLTAILKQQPTSALQLGNPLEQSEPQLLEIK